MNKTQLLEMTQTTAALNAMGLDEFRRTASKLVYEKQTIRFEGRSDEYHQIVVSDGCKFGFVAFRTDSRWHSDTRVLDWLRLRGYRGSGIWDDHRQVTAQIELANSYAEVHNR